MSIKIHEITKQDIPTIANLNLIYLNKNQTIENLFDSISDKELFSDHIFSVKIIPRIVYGFNFKRLRMEIINSEPDYFFTSINDKMPCLMTADQILEKFNNQPQGKHFRIMTSDELSYIPLFHNK